MPDRLLRRPSSSSTSTSTCSSSLVKAYSVSGPRYFKRVTFSDEGDDDSLSACGGIDNLLPWVFLTADQRQELEDVLMSLKNPNPSEVTKALDHLETTTLHRLPPQVFIQRPDLLKQLLAELTLSEKEETQVRAADCLRLLIKRLLGYLDFVEKLPGTDLTSSVPEDSAGKSYNDEIDVLQLRERQIGLVDFVILCLSSISASLSHTRNLEVMNAKTLLFQEVLDLCRHEKGHCDNRLHDSSVRVPTNLIRLEFH